MQAASVDHQPLLAQLQPPSATLGPSFMEQEEGNSQSQVRNGPCVVATRLLAFLPLWTPTDHLAQAESMRRGRWNRDWDHAPLHQCTAPCPPPPQASVVFSDHSVGGQKQQEDAVYRCVRCRRGGCAVSGAPLTPVVLGLGVVVRSCNAMHQMPPPVNSKPRGGGRGNRHFQFAKFGWKVRASPVCLLARQGSTPPPFVLGTKCSAAK